MNPELNQQPDPQQSPTTEPTPITQPLPIAPEMAPQVAPKQPLQQQQSQQSHKKPFVIGGVVILVVTLLTAGIFAFSSDTSVDDNKFTIDDSTMQQTAKTEDQSNSYPENTDNTQMQTSESDDQYYSRTYVIARDTERKTELRNAQQQLEGYYVDFAEYPSDWTLVVTDSDNRFGPRNDAYVYVVSADLQSYTLTADLENDDDIKADANGNYVILSVNQ